MNSKSIHLTLSDDVINDIKKWSMVRRTCGEECTDFERLALLIVSAIENGRQCVSIYIRDQIEKGK